MDGALLPLTLVAGMLLSVPFTAATRLHAQVAISPLPTWNAEPLGDSATRYLTWAREPHVPPSETQATTRSHTKTGLLVGGLIGATATTVFLVGFCSDPDTACGADEVGRAVLFIAVPCAAVGALIGSLVRTEQ